MKSPQVVNLTSSLVKELEYYNQDRELIVHLSDRGGKHLGFKYYNVPEDVFEEFSKAESAGEFYNKNIRNTYEFDKL